MPVTVKLSQKFYETFGDEITNELVEWFNQVDATYRADLRELNELNFTRFDAKLEQRISEVRREMEVGFARLDAKLEQRVAQLDAKLEQVKAELIKWMFIFLAGTTVTILGTMIALLKL